MLPQKIKINILEVASHIEAVNIARILSCCNRVSRLGVRASSNVSLFDSTAVMDRIKSEQMIQTENFDNFAVCIENAVITEAVFLIKKVFLQVDNSCVCRADKRFAPQDKFEILNVIRSTFTRSVLPKIRL